MSRLPAADIEQQVIRQLEQWLPMGPTLLEQLALPADDAAARATILAGATAWQDLGTRAPAHLRAFLMATVRRITVDETAVHLILSRSALRAVLLRENETPTTGLRARTHQEDQEDDLALSVNVMLRRGAKGIRLIVPGEPAAARPAQPNPALITAVARAHVWAERLLSGEASSLRAIAREQGVSEGYVGRILRCTCLAPDLVEIILQGRQPPTLTLEGLVNHLPLAWAEQRQVLGQHSGGRHGR